MKGVAPCATVRVHVAVPASDSKELSMDRAGSISVHLRGGGSVLIEDALVAEQFRHNLLSVVALNRRGFAVRFSGERCLISMQGLVVATGTMRGGQYYLDIAGTDADASGHASAGTVDVPPVHGALDETSYLSDAATGNGFDLWHRRMGHINHAYVRMLRDSGIADGVCFPDKDTKVFCGGCVYGKSARKPFPKGGAQSNAEGDVGGLSGLYHADVIGPLPTSSSGFKYLGHYVHRKTGMRHAYFLSSKSGVLQAHKTHVARVDKQGHAMAILRTDNAREYLSSNFDEVNRSHGVWHQKSTPYTPQQNGLAERDGRSVMEMARAMLHSAGLPTVLWPEAVRTAVYILNRCPKRGHDKTPIEAWTGKRPDLSHMRVFGCEAYMHVPVQKRRKLDPKARKCVFLGYEEDRKCYRLYDQVARRIEYSRDVVFDENVPGYEEKKQYVPCTSADSSDSSDEDGGDGAVSVPADVGGGAGDVDSDAGSVGVSADSDVSGSGDGSGSDADLVEEVRQLMREIRGANGRGVPGSTDVRRDAVGGSRPVRVRQPSGACWRAAQSRLSEEEVDSVSGSGTDGGGSDFALAAGVAESEPRSFREAMDSHRAEDWIVACREEYDSLIKNHTWELVELPAGRRALCTKWVFKIKRNQDGSIARFKARLTARGDRQVKGVDFREVFAPVVRRSTIRVLLAIAQWLDLDLDQMDVVAAFLNGDLDEVIYMKQPEGFAVAGMEQLVCLLRKSIYGLKQASRAWYHELDTFLVGVGFSRCVADPCLYVRRVDGALTIVAVYVDDLIIASNSQGERSRLKELLSARYTMKDLGTLSWCLGMSITRPDTLSIGLDQTLYVKEILRRYGMDECNPASTPAEAGLHLPVQEDVAGH